METCYIDNSRRIEMVLQERGGCVYVCICVIAFVCVRIKGCIRPQTMM